jgi:hypothetical protein
LLLIRPDAAGTRICVFQAQRRPNRNGAEPGTL